MDYVSLPSSRIRYDLTASMRTAKERGIPIVVTYRGAVEFCVVPVGFMVRRVHLTRITYFANYIYKSVAGIGRDKEPAIILDTIKPEQLRKDLTAQKERIRNEMAPMFMTHYYQVFGLLFPIPAEQGIETVLQLAEAWQATVKTQRLGYEAKTRTELPAAL